MIAMKTTVAASYICVVMLILAPHAQAQWAKQSPDGLELVWRHDIHPLLAELRPADDAVELADLYGLTALRASLRQRPIKP